MKKIILLFISVISTTIFSQSSWKKIDSENNFSKTELIQREHQPKKFVLYALSVDNFKANLSTKSKKTSNNILLLPNKNGEVKRFSVKETPILASDLAKKFPSIKTYTAQGIDDPTAVAKITLGTDGVHVIIFSSKNGTLYIDPYNKKRTAYIAYERQGLPKSVSNFSCLLEDSMEEHNHHEEEHQRNANDSKLRTYRIAIACTGEYSQFHLNDQSVPNTADETVKKATILSAMNSTMARVNGIYERDLSVTMVIVNNNDQLIFLDPNTDGLSNSNASALINQSQDKCDNIIGTANYDIGHTFSTGGGGLAGLGVVCVEGQKGRGITGSSQPKNDPYDIDYVAHEVGHQFGAPHTFNNSCGGNRSNAAAVEPGSGSSIMAYAGICAPNVQGNSSDHFHTVSITSMWNHVVNTGTCASETNTNNAAPTANAGANVSVPKSTPLVLRGSATDANSSNLTHCWEQIDTEIAQMPPASISTGGPAFLSLPPSTSPDRYLPALATVIAGNTSSTWEVIPSVARDMNFAYTVRDNHPNGGATARDDMKITVTDAEPFKVTSQNTAETWVAGATHTVTWDKSTTDQAPISCANVRIKLSTDGGVTFPITLVESTPNDGTHTFVVPANPTNTARVIVEAVDNIFYNVNTSNFKIEERDFALSLTNPEVSICKPNNATFNFTYNTFSGFTGTTTFTAENVPTGASVAFNPASASASGTAVTVTVSNLSGIANGTYPITLKGTSGSITESSVATLNVFDTNFSALTLTAPANNATNQILTPTLTWSTDANAKSYDVQIAKDNAFTNIIATATATTNTYTTNELNRDVTYYWRVKAKNNCGEGTYSPVFNFTTENCDVCASAGSIQYTTSTTKVVFNTINNTSTKNDASGNRKGYFDYTNISTTVKRGETHNLTVHATTDGNLTVFTKVWIDWNRDCVFDNNTEAYELGSVRNVTDGATSGSPLNITVPNDAKFGGTVMRVSTQWAEYPTSCETNFDGEVEDYTIVVQDPSATTKDYSFDGFNLYPNPSNGEFNLRFDVINTDKVSITLFDLRGRMIDSKDFYNTATNFSEKLNFNATSGMYLLQIKNGNKQTTRKVTIK